MGILLSEWVPLTRYSVLGAMGQGAQVCALSTLVLAHGLAQGPNMGRTMGWPLRKAGPWASPFSSTKRFGGSAKNRLNAHSCHVKAVELVWLQWRQQRRNFYITHEPGSP